MADSYGRPRIESVGSFVIEDLDPEPAPGECVTFEDPAGRTPSYTVIGEGANGTITLNGNAPVSTLQDTYCIAVVIMARGWNADAGPFRNTTGWTMSSDETTKVPSYLKYNPSWVPGDEEFECFNDTWRTKVLGSGLGTNVWDTVADNGAREGQSWLGKGYVAYRGLQRAMPAGTTITYALDALTTPHTIAKALLIKNAALWTGTSLQNDSAGNIPSFFGVGGVVFSTSLAHGGSANSCGIFTGNLTGPVPAGNTNGAELLEANQTVPDTAWLPNGGPPPCTQIDNNCGYRYTLRIALVAPGGGTYYVGLPAGSTNNPKCDGAWAWPAQGYY